MDLREDCIVSKVLPLPAAFLLFLEENGLDPSIYASAHALPRYIRLKPGCESLLKEIETDLNCKLNEIDWLPNFYSIPSHIQIARSNAYKSGQIYGMDAASGAAVMALDVISGDHVLDLCAAPGAKLCMLADMIGSLGTVTGVDIARHRMAACRNMLQKYELGDRCRLFVADGTTFFLMPLRSHTDSEIDSTVGDMKDTLGEWTPKRTWKERKNAIKRKGTTSSSKPLELLIPELIFYGRYSGAVGLLRNELFHVADANECSSCGYDKVLVDAECTHDGSIKHIQKFEHWGWSTFQSRVLNAKRTQNLSCLQHALLSNGFRLLRVNGSLVYSTCSLTVSQNEAVVKQFLLTNPSAELMKIDLGYKWPCRSGEIPKTLRFDPETSQTSGLFIAKFTKIAS